MRKPLETKFRSNGFDFEVVDRAADVVLVRKTQGRWVSWEVADVKGHDGYTIAGRAIPPAECMPSSSQWGTYGWTYTTEDRARAAWAKRVSDKIMLCP